MDVNAAPFAEKYLDTTAGIRLRIKIRRALWRGHTEPSVSERPFIQSEHP